MGGGCVGGKCMIGARACAYTAHACGNTSSSRIIRGILLHSANTPSQLARSGGGGGRKVDALLLPALPSVVSVVVAAPSLSAVPAA